MNAFFWRCLKGFFLLAVASLLVAWATENEYGLVVLSTGLLLWLLFHLWHLRALLQLLHDPQPDEIPDGYGNWDQVFSLLYRQSRQQSLSQKKLANVLERFINAGEAMPDGVVVLDELDRIEWFNPMAVEHFSLNRKQDIGSQIANLVRQPGFHAYLTEQQYSQPQILRQMRSGGELVLSVQLVPFDSTRKLLLSRDITQLERVQTVHRDFVANVSHELRTPLTVVGGFLETLSDMPDVDSQTLRQFLPMMMEQAKRMQNLVEDLLTLSRLESNPISSAHDVVEMEDMLRTLLIEAEGLSQGRHQVVLAEVATMNLSGEPSELHSAFGNLVSNAVRYTPEGGTITLRWRVDGKGTDHERAVFSVTDTGIGIAREHIPRLTERFYRVDRGRSRGTGGTGLGLAIVKHVLARHHARLEVDSELERGSTFSVVFPSDRLIHVDESEH